MIIYQCNQNKTMKSGIDYTIVDLVSPTELSVGNSGKLDFLLINQGEKDGINSLEISLYISSVYYLDDTKAIFLNKIIVPTGLKKGEKSAQQINYLIPATSPAKAFLVLKIVSVDEESDTYNNVISTSLIKIIGGIIIRLEILADNIFHDLTINSFELKYYFFKAIAGHAYRIYWDDFYEGTKFFNQGADIRVTSKSEDETITFFLDEDNGYYLPKTVSTAIGENISIDIKSSSFSGGFAIKIQDAGIPPDLNITIDSHSYNNPSKTLDLTITVRNTATVSSNGNCFYIGFWRDQPSQPSPGATADYYANFCPIIAPGGQFTTTVNMPSLINTGTAYALVDAYDSLTESDETNNYTVPYAW